MSGDWLDLPVTIGWALGVGLAVVAVYVLVVCAVHIVRKARRK